MVTQVRRRQAPSYGNQVFSKDIASRDGYTIHTSLVTNGNLVYSESILSPRVSINMGLCLGKAAGGHTSRWPCWPDLPPEIAGLILSRLGSHDDRLSFAAVCPEWRLAAEQHRTPLPPAIPCISLGDGRRLPEHRRRHGVTGPKLKRNAIWWMVWVDFTGALRSLLFPCLTTNREREHPGKEKQSFSTTRNYLRLFRRLPFIHPDPIEPASIRFLRAIPRTRS